LTPTLKAATRVGDFFTAQLGGNHIYADERLIDHEVAAIHLKSHPRYRWRQYLFAVGRSWSPTFVGET
jgi:hypothetical protein